MKQRSCKLPLCALCMVFLLLAGSFTKAGAPSQSKKEPPLRCTRAALQALKTFPELRYTCAGRDEDSLKSPARKRALSRQMKQLEGFNSPAWWAAGVDELNVCAEFKKPHVLSSDEFYQMTLYGDSQTRLLITDDPCVKYSYGTLNVFVLQRAANRVVVTQVLNGYFSRADNAVSMKIADTGSQRILEINAGTGGLQPYVTSFLYTIDKRTNRALPKRLIKDGKAFTHEMNSFYALDVWANKFDFELPESWEEMSIIKNGRLADQFYVYHEGVEGLERTVFKWNGSYYEVAKR
jgi:hypothetical protein